MTKGQFYVIALVFVAISLFVMLSLTQFVEFGSLSGGTSSSGFRILQNSVTQRNTWLPTYWADLRWQTKTVVTITGTPTNPVRINADIVGDCINTVRVFKKTGSQFTELPSQVTAPVSPCDAIFTATAGTYEIYWNSITTIPTKTIGTGTPPSYTKRVEQVPGEGVCSSLGDDLAKKGVLLQCSATAKTNTYNYYVNYSSPDFAYSGNLG